MVSAGRGHAQARPRSIVGLVRSETGDVLTNTEVTLDRVAASSRRTRTDEQGRFVFANLRPGPHALHFRRLGYFPQELGVILADSGATLTVVLVRVPAPLDTIRVIGHQVGVLGVVASHEGLRPVAGAEVGILHTRARTTTKDDGRFAIVDSVGSGPQVVFAKAEGFLSRMLSVMVPESSTVEVGLVLEAMSAPGAKRIAMPLAELEERSHWMGRGAALVSGAELAEFRGENLARALRKVASLYERGFFAGGCILVNGWQRVRSLEDFDADEVEAVEFFQAGTDYTNTLASRGCPSSAAMPRLAPRPGTRPRRNVTGMPTTVIWLKR